MVTKQERDSAVIEVTLPGALKPKRSAQLIRLGRDNDGGYLVDGRDVARSDSLISFGINDDWSFETAFVARNAVPVQAYDGSVGTWRFTRRVVGRVLRLENMARIRKGVRILVDYLGFFSGPRKHVRRYVGPESAGDVQSLRSILDDCRARGFRKPFAKIDIEGAEYSVLDELLRHADQLAGLVLEFHACDVKLDEIQSFIERCPLALVHVHANNYAPLGRDGIPTALELTFSSEATDGPWVGPLPHELDMTNDVEINDWALKFP